MSDVKTLVGDFFATMGRRDYEKVRDEFLTEGSSWTMMAPSMGDGLPLLDSSDKIVEFFAGGDAMFVHGAPEITINRILVEGDHAAVEAVGQGPLQNGKQYSNVYHFAIDTKDGRIVAIREYMDSFHVADVLGPA